MIPREKDVVKFGCEIIDGSISLYSGGELQMFQGQYLRIKDLPGIFYSRYGKIPENILIRHCYRRLYDIASNHMVNYDGDLPATLFTGVPGIGKSLFLIYFLFRFLHDTRFPDKRFAIEFASAEYFYFEPKSISSDEYYCSVETQITTPTLQIPIFSDVKSMTEPRGRGRWLFIFSSPNPLRYKETIKNSPKFCFTLPTWSYEELKFLDSDDTNWIAAFILFGGVPRNVFWDGTETNPAIKLSDTLESKGGIIAENFFRRGFGNIDPENSYMILHVNPPWCPEQNDWLYDQAVVYSFASDEIFKKIAEKRQIIK